MRHWLATSGTYLVLWTALLCEKQVCAQGICQAMFTYQTFSCMVGVTSTSVAPFDSIVSYIWEWGDGTSPDTFSVAFAFHLYTQSDTYRICHTIVTSKGCRNTFCQDVVIADCGAGAFCVASFETGGNGCLLALRNTSFVMPGDSLELLVVDWGDSHSDTIEANLTAHNYAQNGQYVVCLSITSREGCTDIACDTIVVSGCVPTTIPDFSQKLFAWRSSSPLYYYLDGRQMVGALPVYGNLPVILILAEGEKRLVVPK